MDDKSVNWSQDRYKEIKGEVDKMLTKIVNKTKKITLITMYGFKGDNLKDPSQNMKWWKGFTVKVKKEKLSGMTLVDALEKVVRPPKRNNKKAIRMPVSGVYKIKGVGDLITGRVEQGTLTDGVFVILYPTGCSGFLFSVELLDNSVEKSNF
eukprot:318205_1